MVNSKFSLKRVFKPGVLSGSQVRKLFDYAKERGFAIPAVNVTSSLSVNAVLEAASSVNSPVIIQISNSGAHFFSGSSLSNESDVSSVNGAVAMAKYVHSVAKFYGVPVILHTDHCNRKHLSWLEGLIRENKKFFKVHKRALFSSHMLDLSAEPFVDNIRLSLKYFKKLSDLGIFFEVEIGVTGGEEDGIDNSNVSKKRLYTDPKDVAVFYNELRKVSKNFSIAAAFGNVHGVYKPGNVKLKPKILRDCQSFIKEEFKLKSEKPVSFVFHGGSGSPLKKIKEAVSYGVVKMNIDTDTQWAFTSGVRDYILKNIDYLKTQIGNPDGEDLPNKKFYDPRKVLRFGEVYMVKRLKKAFKDLNCLERYV